jgi:MFS transporter, DHA2 family, multidrug resistance protein
VVIGATVRRQALILGCSATFMVIGTVLALAAVLILLASKPRTGDSGGAH